MKKTDSNNQNENTIISDSNIEKHPSDESGNEENSEDNESSDDDKSLQNETLWKSHGHAV